MRNYWVTKTYCELRNKIVNEFRKQNQLLHQYTRIVETIYKNTLNLDSNILNNVNNNEIKKKLF